MYSDSFAINAAYFGRRAMKWAIGKDHLTRKDVNLPKRRLGTRYGGWFVYEMPLGENPAPVVLSFGIGNDISFDLELIRKFNATVYAFDPTPMSLDWLKTQNLPDRFVAFPIGVAAVDGEIEFGLPQREGWDSYSVLDKRRGSVNCPVKTLQSIIDMTTQDKEIDLLKMDIEGSEFEVLDDLHTLTIRPKQLLVEFHYHEKSMEKKHHDVLRHIELLRRDGYLVYDISPWGREFSLIRSDVLSR